jgi:hypothetical protein
MQKIAAAFVKAKRAFGPVLKDKTNPAFRSKYADLGACLEAIDAPCLDAGIAVYQETFEDATGVTVETVFLHESGESLRCGKFHVPAAKQDPQGYGSALTYARRYSLLAACGMAPEDDDGNAASKPSAASAAPREGMAESCIIDLIGVITDQRTPQAIRATLAEAKTACENTNSPQAYARIVAAAKSAAAALKAPA